MKMNRKLFIEPNKYRKSQPLLLIIDYEKIARKGLLQLF